MFQTITDPVFPSLNTFRDVSTGFGFFFGCVWGIFTIFGGVAGLDFLGFLQQMKRHLKCWTRVFWRRPHDLETQKVVFEMAMTFGDKDLFFVEIRHRWPVGVCQIFRCQV